MGSTSSLFIQLSVVLGLAAFCGYFIKLLRLPLVVAYIITGVLLSFLQFFDATTYQILTYLPDIGIAFVLFFVGMELDLKEIKNLGKPILFGSLGQILIAFATGFLIATTLGRSPVESFYLGVGLSFSSTIVAVTLLLERKDLGSLYGKLCIGILLIEDLVAILILMAMMVTSSSLHLGLQNSLPWLALFAKGAFLLILSLGLSRYVLQKVFAAVANSPELLFLSALAWFFVVVAVALLLGFSVVIGAFLAGLALANSPFHFEIAGKVKPLRDFFVTLFFVYLGSRVGFSHLGEVLPLIALFTVYALILKPVVFVLILGIFGFRKHTLFQTAVHLSQISEFSLIIMLMGQRMGLLPESALTAMALTGVLSIIASSILISSSGVIYPILTPFIAFFEHKSSRHQSENETREVELEDHVILVGAHRIGGEIMKFLKRERIPFLVLDFNPSVVEKLMADKIHTLYGDLGDPEILEFLNLDKAKLIISTASNLDDNLTLLAEVKRRKVRAVVITRAESATDALLMYRSGADYVILPEMVSGDFVAQILRNNWPSMNFFKDRAEVELNKLSRSHLAFE